MLPVGTTKELVRNSHNLGGGYELIFSFQLGVLEYAWCLDFGALDLSSPEHVVCCKCHFGHARSV